MIFNKLTRSLMNISCQFDSHVSQNDLGIGISGNVVRSIGDFFHNGSDICPVNEL